jgi:serine/threonine protein kinase
VSNPDEPKKKAPPPTIQWDPNQGPLSTDPEPPAEESEKAGPQPTIQWDPAQGPSQPTPAPQPTPLPTPLPTSQPTPSSPPPAPTAFDEDEDPLVGTLLRDKWEVLKRLGAGSFGTVYKVKDVKGGWIEALKILGVDRITGGEAETVRKRFLREAQIMKRLGTQSAHIVGLSTYEEDLEAGLIYFLMEYVDGKSMGDALMEQGPFSVERTLMLALQVCDALVVAHEGEEGVVHRDLKLENIMLTQDRSGAEIAKVLDFGIAKLAAKDADSRLTTAGTLGTPGFAAPEQLRAEDVDGRTDLFAFGVVLYCLLTGRDPWFGNPAGEPTTQVYELMVATERAEMKPFAEAGVELPPALANVVVRLLRRDPDQRFQSARELKAVLERIAAGGEALDQGSIRVLTDEPGVRVVVRSGRKVVAEGPTPCDANGLSEGTYKIQLQDSRFEESEITVTLGIGAMEDVSVLTTPRKMGFGATLGRKKGAMAVAMVVILLMTGTGMVQPWGRTLALGELEIQAAEGGVTTVRLTEEGLRGQMAVLGIPAPFRVPFPQDEAPGVVTRMRSAGLVVDTSWEVSRLVRLAQEAQAEMHYFDRPGADVRSYAEKVRTLEPTSPQARSLLLKVAERMAWDAEAALQDGSPELARELAQECLSVVPGHPGCQALGAEG